MSEEERLIFDELYQLAQKLKPMRRGRVICALWELIKPSRQELDEYFQDLDSSDGADNLMGRIYKNTLSGPTT